MSPGSWKMAIVHLLKIVIETSKKQLSIFQMHFTILTTCESFSLNAHVFVEIWKF